MTENEEKLEITFTLRNIMSKKNSHSTSVTKKNSFSVVCNSIALLSLTQWEHTHVSHLDIPLNFVSFFVPLLLIFPFTCTFFVTLYVVAAIFFIHCCCLFLNSTHIFFSQEFAKDNDASFHTLFVYSHLRFSLLNVAL